MKRTVKTVIALVAVTSLLAACDQANGGPQMNKQTVGALGGAAVGGILGSNVGKGKGNTAAIIGGTLLGAYLGSEIGSSLDNADRMMHSQTSQRAFETAQPGQSLPWNSSHSNASGMITPAGYYQTASGQYCREFSQTITVDGRTERGHGRACREPDGSWRIVN
jgi:surface antigen